MSKKVKHESFEAWEQEDDKGCLICPLCLKNRNHPGDCDCGCELARTYWFSKDLGIKDEPIIPSLFRYRQSENREQVSRIADGANLVSSKTRGGKHLPIIDLDFPHRYFPSSTPGHGHLYLNRPISKWRWLVLMWALRYAKVLNRGGFLWSLRRGSNFARLPGYSKGESEEVFHYTYGWFFKRKR